MTLSESPTVFLFLKTEHDLGWNMNCFKGMFSKLAFIRCTGLRKMEDPERGSWELVAHS